MSENNVKDLKKKIFNVSDDLHMLYSSYESLQVITADSSAEAVHVCAVLDGLNYRFEALIKQLDMLYKQSDTHLSVVVFNEF